MRSNSLRRVFRLSGWAAAMSMCLAAAAAQGERADAQGQTDTRGFSRQMKLAVDLYDRGEDLDAMDRFMDILVKGSPAERPMANEYLNLITQRMSQNASVAPPKSPQAAVIETSAGKPSPKKASAREEDRGPAVVSEGRGGRQSLSGSDKEVMAREIEAKIQNRTRLALQKLEKYEDIRVHMATRRVPRAVGIPTDLLFESGIQFKKEASRILDIITEMIFSLGATQAVILPEGTVIGNTKILDMRRTMGISAHFYKAGIAPPRIRVNLLSTQVEIPPELQDFRGILIVLLYNQPLGLSSDTTVGEEAGPPVSLGVNPASFDPARGEGGIIEFSVVEPPAGLMSWRFQLLGQGSERRKGGDLAVLQEVKGSAPVFHQIFWNGRRNYFGSAYPPGQYECVLSATDMKNRSRKKHLWITLEGEAPVELAAAPAPAAEKADAPDKVEAKTKKPSAPEPRIIGEAEEEAARAAEEGAPAAKVKAPSKGKSAPKPARAARGAKAKAAKAKKAEPAVEAEETPPAPKAGPEPAPVPAVPDASSEKKKTAEPAQPNTMSYVISFSKNQAVIAPGSESVLGNIADNMELYPLAKINLLGYANSGEPDAEGLARKRLDLVKKQLVDQYKMRPDKMREEVKVTEEDVYKVEVYILR